MCLERRDWAPAFELTRDAVELAPTVCFHGYADGFYAGAQCHTGALEEGLAFLEPFHP